jgi:hypothetical protein
MYKNDLQYDESLPVQKRNMKAAYMDFFKENEQPVACI